MGENTKISWADDTANFWSGCTKVSPGCAHCYAETLSERGMGKDTPAGKTLGNWGKGAPCKRHESAFQSVPNWNKKPWVCDRCARAFPIPQAHHCAAVNAIVTTDDQNSGFHRRRVFSLSLGDWLDDEVPIKWLADMLDVIWRCPALDFLLLTKRPQNCYSRLMAVCGWRAVRHQGKDDDEFLHWADAWLKGRPPANIWFGVSAENQQMADERLAILRTIPARVRFVSAEPLLGPIDFSDHFHLHRVKPDWLILGGESGRGAQPCNIGWIRAIGTQCRIAGVAPFVKQLGSNPFLVALEGGQVAINEDIQLRDKKGGNMAEWPEDLRVREFPVLQDARTQNPEPSPE